MMRSRRIVHSFARSTRLHGHEYSTTNDKTPPACLDSEAQKAPFKQTVDEDSPPSPPPPACDERFSGIAGPRATMHAGTHARVQAGHVWV